MENSASDVRARLDHPAFATIAGTAAGYALLLLVIFGVLFVVPWLVLSMF